MPWVLILIGFLCHSAQAAAIYSTLKESAGYYWIMLIASNFTSFLWLYLAANTAQQKDIMVYGVVWDFTILLAYIIVPIVFSGVRPSALTYAGVVVVITGIIMMKLGNVLT